MTSTEVGLMDQLQKIITEDFSVTYLGRPASDSWRTFEISETMYFNLERLKGSGFKLIMKETGYGVLIDFTRPLKPQIFEFLMNAMFSTPGTET